MNPHGDKVMCRRCGFKMPATNNLIKHLKRKHPCEPLIEDVPIETLMQETLTRFRNVIKDQVTGETMYLCNKCGRGFKDTGNKCRHQDKCDYGPERVFTAPSKWMTTEDIETIRQEIREEEKAALPVDLEKQMETRLKESIEREIAYKVEYETRQTIINEIRKEVSPVEKQVKDLIVDDLLLLRKTIVKHLSHRNTYIRAFTGFITKMVKKIDNMIRSPTDSLSETTADLTLEEELECATMASEDMDAYGAVHVTTPVTKVLSFDHESSTHNSSLLGINHGTANVYRDNNTYNIHLPAAPLTRPVEQITLRPYNAPEIPTADVLKDIIIKPHYSALTIHEFVAEAVRAIYCFSRENNSLIYNSVCNDAYVYVNESVGVRYLHGDKLLSDVLNVVCTQVDALYADGEIEEGRARLILDCLRSQQKDMLRHVAPVLHRASHDILGELRHTWKRRFPEYVRQLCRLEHKYKSTHIAHTMPTE